MSTPRAALRSGASSPRSHSAMLTTSDAGAGFAVVGTAPPEAADSAHPATAVAAVAGRIMFRRVCCHSTGQAPAASAAANCPPPLPPVPLRWLLWLDGCGVEEMTTCGAEAREMPSMKRSLVAQWQVVGLEGSGMNGRLWAVSCLCTQRYRLMRAAAGTGDAGDGLRRDRAIPTESTT